MEPAQLDCLACGACCTDVLFTDVPVEDDDLVLRLYPERVVSKRIGLVLERKGAQCFALDCSTGETRCIIYAERPAACRLFEAGSADCLRARAKAGVAG